MSYFRLLLHTASQQCLHSILLLLFVAGLITRSHAQPQSPPAGIPIALQISTTPLQQSFDNAVLRFSDGNSTYTYNLRSDVLPDIRLPYGIYRVELRHINFEPFILDEFQVLPGKDPILNIALIQKPYPLAEIVVPDSGLAISLQAREGYAFTVEQTQRFAASFFDPARLVTALPGVATGSDEGNHLSIRGNSPQSTSWRMQGADIVNPNHLANGGTFTDRISMSGGGVSILSAQLMGTSALYTGAFPVSMGNALGGVFDMSLREGSSERRRYTLQASVIGLDAAIEGPLAKKNQASYLANYRYSTTGLLALMGIDFGGQVFGFQDAAFHLKTNAGKLGRIGLFGLGGYSLNRYTPPTNPQLWATGTDRTVLDFSQYMGATGITHQANLSPNTQFYQVFALSAHRSQNYFALLDSTATTYPKDLDRYAYGKGVWHAYITHQHTAKTQLTIGQDLQYHFFQLQSTTYPKPWGSPGIPLLQTHQNAWLYQPYLAAQHSISPRLLAIAGLRLSTFSLHSQAALDPYAQLRFSVTPRILTRLSYRLTSQIQPLGAYSYIDSTGTTRPNPLRFSRAHHLGIHTQYSLSRSTTLSSELYYQSLFHIPTTGTPTDFSIINSADGFTPFPLINQGRGYNTGIEINLRRSFSSQWYTLSSLTLFDSKYLASDGIWRDTRFNRRFLTHFAAGKEWNWHTQSKRRYIGADIRIFYNGGLRDTPIDITASQATGRTTYVQGQAFTRRLPAYFRTDLRLSIRKVTRNYTRTLALEFQNLTNHQNIAFYLYDDLNQQAIPKYQLGLIPNLSYRIEF